MKIKLWAVVIISFLSIASCEKEDDQGQQIYFNSFESLSDTIGWRGYAFDFADDVPEHGGKRSLSVSGGCVAPHAQYTVPPQNTDSFLIFRCWGKNLSYGGAVCLYVNKGGYGGISFDISKKSWTLYVSIDTLFCPANTSLTLEALSGGITYSSMLIDMIEIRKLDVNP